MDLIGGKYKSLILWYLNDNKILRFNELSRYIPDATSKMLTRQLRNLEQDGLIERKVYPEVPPKVEYKLTSFGKSLYPILNAMDNWGLEYLDDNGIIIGEN
ncbi:winged helix-turn-helix transcriptional regulator [Clostridium sp. OS1-26]|uniref:winged helix-turn-helix transcriptional regulator n=1 Tax=Clostridium sp. OS1-26 TaxID=3070681 RepID=UPI0035A97CCF